MNCLRTFLIVLIFLAQSCKDNRINEVFCQGEVIEETSLNIATRKTIYKIYFACAGQCKDGTPCDSIVKNYDPPLPGGIVREVWCGCKGGQSLQDCDVILQTIRPQRDTILRRAKCPPRDRSCMVPGDSCLPRYKSLKDTIRSAFTQRDSIYRQRWVTTCECLNRSGS